MPDLRLITHHACLVLNSTVPLLTKRVPSMVLALGSFNSNSRCSSNNRVAGVSLLHCYLPALAPAPVSLPHRSAQVPRARGCLVRPNCRTNRHPYRPPVHQPLAASQSRNHQLTLRSRILSRYHPQFQPPRQVPLQHRLLKPQLRPLPLVPPLHYYSVNPSGAQSLIVTRVTSRPMASSTT